MSLSRRSLLSTALGLWGGSRLMATGSDDVTHTRSSRDGFDPWLEVDAAALKWNVNAVQRLAGGRPILAVLKNNAYGLGLGVVGPVFDALPAIRGFAVVRTEEALTLRRAGVRKPVLLMGRSGEAQALELAQSDVALAAFDDEAPARFASIAQRLGRTVGLQLYIDTGMGRMGRSYRRVADWLDAVLSQRGLRIDGMFTELTEDPDFDREQVSRLQQLAAAARARGLEVGPLHAASSAAVTHQPETHLDLVRPGLALYGGYVSKTAKERAILRPAYRLQARVVRTELLQPGDGVSYHRRWIARSPTWIAVLPVGHVDGYPAGAVKGGQILSGGRLYHVIGTVSASHTIIEVGEEPTVRVGDLATLVGDADPAIHPNEVAERAGYSEYDMFMHLNPELPRQLMG